MGTAYNPKIVTDGLVLCLDAANRKSYPGSGTTWTDLSGNGNNGTLTNGPTFDSANGGSIIFDGVNDYISLGEDKFEYQDNFTVEAIFKFTSLPNNAAGACAARHPIIYNHDYGYNLLISSTGTVRWYIYNTSSLNKSIETSYSIIGDTPIHAIGTKQGTLISLYVNGNFITSDNLTTNAVYYTNSGGFVIGGYALCGGNRFYSTGNIYLTKVYDRALTAAEIQQNFQATRGRYGI